MGGHYPGFLRVRTCWQHSAEPGWLLRNGGSLSPLEPHEVEEAGLAVAILTVSHGRASSVEPTVGGRKPPTPPPPCGCPGGLAAKHGAPGVPEVLAEAALWLQTAPCLT